MTTEEVKTPSGETPGNPQEETPGNPQSQENSSPSSWLVQKTQKHTHPKGKI